ncbi:TrmH family RNA methyltransferase [Ekhidna sp.]|uniref:TrmH family RNA methyltransferase n=1 Tax=Ekhidna sp. TaxID=2608089 RepID=UPI003B5016FA
MLSRKEQKLIKSLKVKKYRVREKRFLVEGAKNVLELLQSDFEIDLIVGTEDYFSLNLKTGNHRNEVVKPDLLAQLGTFKTNEDVLAVAKTKSTSLEEIVFNDHLFVLDDVKDPGNVGTIIRTLDWFGFSQLICSDNCAEFYHPKVINSTMGSFTRLKVIHIDLNEFYKMNKLPILITDMAGEPLNETTIDEPSVIVMGSESHGISELSEKVADKKIAIPKYGQAESLNVGIATGILAGHLRML